MSYTLYYSPGVCSLASHITLSEAGHSYDLKKVDLASKKTEDGMDFTQIAEKGAVPALQLPDGSLLTEGVAIMQYLADQKPEAKLAPANGTLERARLQEWLNYIASEFHKTHWPLFHAAEAGEQAKGVYLKKLNGVYDYLNKKLSGQPYAMGEQFTIADAYLFTVINWHNFIGVDLSAWPALVAFQARISARPAVQRALEAEGLLKKAAA